MSSEKVLRTTKNELWTGKLILLGNQKYLIHFRCAKCKRLVYDFWVETEKEGNTVYNDLLGIPCNKCGEPTEYFSD
jgi:hypothetical protein